MSLDRKFIEVNDEQAINDRVNNVLPKENDPNARILIGK